EASERSWKRPVAEHKDDRAGGEMNDIVNAETGSNRVVIDAFEKQFARLHSLSCSLIEATPAEILYRNPRQITGTSAVYSVGENVVRSAGAIEQTFGGITANLWDDPFEWTLPENLSTPERVVGYLVEVEVTRRHGFELFKGDDDLLKDILAPAGETRLLPLLLDTLVRAVHHQGRAFATLD